MNKYIKHWSVAACAALAVTTAFSSCKKDGDSVEELMERNYPARVYLQSDRYSAPSQTFALQHGEDGVTGFLSDEFTVRLTRAQAQDVVVSIKASIDNAELADALSLSTSEVTIKAGQLISAPISFSLDKAKLDVRQAQEAYKVTIAIDAIKSAPAGLQLSSNLSVYAATFNKKEQNEDAIVAGDSFTNWDYLDYDERAANWKLINVTPGVKNDTNPTVLFDGQNTDLATDNPPLSFTVDFGRVVPKLRGVTLQYWGDDYIPNAFRIEISEDGQIWKTIGIPNDYIIHYLAGIDFKKIMFKKAYPARYVRYTALAKAPLTDGGRISIAEFYAMIELEGGNQDGNQGGSSETDTPPNLFPTTSSK